MGDRLDRRHQSARHPGRARVAARRPRRRREPRPRAGRGVRRRVVDPAGLRLLRGAPRRPGDRRRLHLAPEHAPLRVVDPGRRGGQARAVREAPLPAPGRGRGGLRRGGARRPAALGGVHVPPQPSDRAAARARRRRRDRRAAAGPLGVQLLALRRGQHPPAARGRGRRADGRRLLLRQRDAAARRRARERLRPGVDRRERHRLGLHRLAPVPGRRAGGVRLRQRPSPGATSWRRSAAKARSSSTTRGTAAGQ